MKLILVFSFITASFAAFAQAEPKFAEQKQRMIDELGKQISALQTTKTCVEGASDREGIKKCHEIAKAERVKIQSERKKVQAERIDSQIQKLEEEKKKMEEKK